MCTCLFKNSVFLNLRFFPAHPNKQRFKKTKLKNKTKKQKEWPRSCLFGLFFSDLTLPNHSNMYF